MLPPCMKGQADRLCKRALIYFETKTDPQDYPPVDVFFKCVLAAAEMGLAIDGRLCHVVRFKSKWQCVPDYKGIIAVAKRSGVILDCLPKVVHENDPFSASVEDGKSRLDHEELKVGDRGKVIGAYAIVYPPNAPYRYDWMSIDELNSIQRAAPAQKGPWSTHVNEMRKKTVVKRIMKLFQEDAGVARALELSDEAEGYGDTPAQVPSAPPIGRVSLRPKPVPVIMDEPPMEHYQQDPEPVEEQPGKKAPTKRKATEKQIDEIEAFKPKLGESVVVRMVAEYVDGPIDDLQDFQAREVIERLTATTVVHREAGVEDEE